MSNAWKAFLSVCIPTVKSKCRTVSVQAVKQDHMVSEGYRQMWSATLHVPTHSVSFVSHIFTQSQLVLLVWLNRFCSFKWFSEKKKKENKIAYLRCRKRSISSITSIDQHVKLNPGVRSGLGSKLLQHSSFPSKHLVTTCNCGAVMSCENSKLLLTAREPLSPFMAAP